MLSHAHSLSLFLSFNSLERWSQEIALNLRKIQFDITQIYPAEEIERIKIQFVVNIVPSSTQNVLETIRLSPLLFTHVVFWRLTEHGTASVQKYPIPHGIGLGPYSNLDRFLFTTNAFFSNAGSRPMTILVPCPLQPVSIDQQHHPISSSNQVPLPSQIDPYQRKTSNPLQFVTCIQFIKPFLSHPNLIAINPGFYNGPPRPFEIALKEETENTLLQMFNLVAKMIPRSIPENSVIWPKRGEQGLISLSLLRSVCYVCVCVCVILNVYTKNQ